MYNCIGVVYVRLSIHNTTNINMKEQSNPTEIEESKKMFLPLFVVLLVKIVK